MIADKHSAATVLRYARQICILGLQARASKYQYIQGRVDFLLGEISTDFQRLSGLIKDLEITDRAFLHGFCHQGRS